MALWAAPHLTFRPQGEFPEFKNLGVISRHAVDDWQVAGIIDARLGPKAAKDALGFQGQEPTVGAFPQGSVEQQDAGWVLAPGIPSRVRSGISS